ncbi:MAG: hypothetical protein M3041_09035 [Acidobacteriota bacterium]|nr:hypothetical protein [Acidobacteriota bacterium]
MRRFAIALSLAGLAGSIAAQTPPRGTRGPRPSQTADIAEGAVKQAMQQLGETKKICERDIGVLAHLRAADDALADTMQPTNAIQKAYEEVGAAKALSPEFFVMQGVVKSERVLEEARRSPMTADFGRLRSVLRDEALGPASRVAVRDALRLEDEALGWLRVQQLIADHLRSIAEISNQSLRAAER